MRATAPPATCTPGGWPASPATSHFRQGQEHGDATGLARSADFSMAACRGQGGWVPAEVRATNVVPTYHWFDGTSLANVLGQVPIQNAQGEYVLALPNGSVQSPGAKLFPMKLHRSNSARQDATGLLIPHSTFAFFTSGDFAQAVAAGPGAVRPGWPGERGAGAGIPDASTTASKRRQRAAMRRLPFGLYHRRTGAHEPAGRPGLCAQGHHYPGLQPMPWQQGPPGASSGTTTTTSADEAMTARAVTTSPAPSAA